MFDKLLFIINGQFYFFLVVSFGFFQNFRILIKKLKTFLKVFFKVSICFIYSKLTMQPYISYTLRMAPLSTDLTKKLFPSLHISGSQRQEKLTCNGKDLDDYILKLYSINSSNYELVKHYESNQLFCLFFLLLFIIFSLFLFLIHRHFEASKGLILSKQKNFYIKITIPAFLV